MFESLTVQGEWSNVTHLINNAENVANQLQEVTVTLYYLLHSIWLSETVTMARSIIGRCHIDCFAPVVWCITHSIHLSAKLTSFTCHPRTVWQRQWGVYFCGHSCPTPGFTRLCLDTDYTLDINLTHDFYLPLEIVGYLKCCYWLFPLVMTRRQLTFLTIALFP